MLCDIITCTKSHQSSKRCIFFHNICSWHRTTWRASTAAMYLSSMASQGLAKPPLLPWQHVKHAKCTMGKAPSFSGMITCVCVCVCVCVHACLCKHMHAHAVSIAQEVCWCGMWWCIGFHSTTWEGATWCWRKLYNSVMVLVCRVWHVLSWLTPQIQLGWHHTRLQHDVYERNCSWLSENIDTLFVTDVSATLFVTDVSAPHETAVQGSWRKLFIIQW